MLVGALLAVTFQTSERIVDLARSDENHTGRNLSDSSLYQIDCRGRASGRSEPAPPLRLAVAGLDSFELSMGGRILADLRLTNIGKETLIIPSVFSHEFGGGFELRPYAIQAALGISAIDAAGREHDLTGTILRGSPARPDTTESIGPGESVTVRFPGWIVGVDGPSAPVTGEAQLFARLILRDNECRTWQPVRSARVKVRLNGRN